MSRPNPSPLAQANRLIGLLRHLVGLRIAMWKAEAMSRFNALLVALAIAFAAATLALLALVFALLAAAVALQSVFGLSAAQAYGAVSGGGVLLAVVLALAARRVLRRALRPVDLRPVERAEPD